MLELSSFSGGNASDLLTSLEAKLEKQQKDLEAGQRPSPGGVRACARASCGCARSVNA